MVWMIGVLLGWVIGATPAQAQGLPRLPEPVAPVAAPRYPPVPLAVKIERIVGPWELSTPNGEKQCRLSHASAKGKTGMTVSFEVPCGTDFQITNDVAGWAMTPQGHLQWVSASGSVLLDFAETDTGIYEALRPGDPTVYFLTNLALAGASIPTPSDVAGPWTMARPQTRLSCSLVLEEDVLGGGASPMEERLVVKPSEACEKSFNGLKLFAWRLERELLVLYSSSADQPVLSFRRDGEGRWNKVPADRQPLSLAKP